MRENHPPPLAITGLTKCYGSFKAVDNVSFSLRQGEIFGLLGPNGAGKTTIISTIMTLQKATHGTITVLGVDMRTDPTRGKFLIGYVPQEIVNHGFFDVETIIEYYAGYYGKRKTKEEIRSLLRKLRLYEYRDRPVTTLSGGMKRRLMIAKALIHDPEVIFLDEPTAGVDSELRQSLWRFIKELKEKNTSILLTTHYLAEAEQLCDRIGIMRQGQLISVDTVENLLDRYALKKVFFILRPPHDTICLRVPRQTTIHECLKMKSLRFEELVDVKVEPDTLEDVMELILHRTDP